MGLDSTPSFPEIDMRPPSGSTPSHDQEDSQMNRWRTRFYRYLSIVVLRGCFVPRRPLSGSISLEHYQRAGAVLLSLICANCLRQVQSNMRTWDYRESRNSIKFASSKESTKPIPFCGLQLTLHSLYLLVVTLLIHGEAEVVYKSQSHQLSYPDLHAAKSTRNYTRLTRRRR